MSGVGRQTEVLINDEAEELKKAIEEADAAERAAREAKKAETDLTAELNAIREQEKEAERAAQENRRRTEAEANRRAEAEAAERRARAEREVQAQRQAELEAKRRAEAEMKARREAEANCKSAAEPQHTQHTASQEPQHSAPKFTTADLTAEYNYAIQAGRLPLSLSIETQNGLLLRVANIGDSLPIKATKVFSTGNNIPEALAVRLYAGERLFAGDNLLIADLKIDGIRKMPYGRPIISVVLDIDHDMNINIEATDEGSLNNARTHVDGGWVPSSDKVLSMIRDAQDNAQSDAQRASRARLLQTAGESLCRAELKYKTVKRKLAPEKHSKYIRYMRDLKSKMKRQDADDMTDVVEKAIIDAVNKLNALVYSE